jgi:branched-chain amino acid transport system ATP-binding protein
MLVIDQLESGYGSTQILWKLNLEARKGKITALLGPNGAGKSTFLKTVQGIFEPWRGKILYEGQDITRLAADKKVDLGIALVPEGRHLFTNLSVLENLMMGAYLKKASKRKNESLEIVYDLFPVLKERSGQKAGSFSGGEQQMLTIARALMTCPRLIMLDEPGQGLSPKLVGEVFESIKKMRDDLGLTVILVEQNTGISLGIADYVFIISEGRVKAGGTPDEIKSAPQIKEAYLGL